MNSCLGRLAPSCRSSFNGHGLRDVAAPVGRVKFGEASCRLQFPAGTLQDAGNGTSSRKYSLVTHAPWFCQVLASEWLRLRRAPQTGLGLPASTTPDVEPEPRTDWTNRSESAHRARACLKRMKGMMAQLDIADCINETCPWSGKPVQSDSLTRCDGQVVGFCNSGCRDWFETAIRHFAEAKAATTER